MSRFGKNLKKIRSLKGFTQTQLADELHLSRGMISSYEEGRAEPKIETLLEVSQIFNVSIDSLLKENLTVNKLSGFVLPENLPGMDTSKTKVKNNELPFLPADGLYLDAHNIEFEDAFLECAYIFCKKAKPSLTKYQFIQTHNTTYCGLPIALPTDSIVFKRRSFSKEEILITYEVYGLFKNIGFVSLLEQRVSALESKIIALENNIQKP